MLNNFCTAVSFLTIIPLPAKTDRKDALARSMLFFPLVGFFIALLSLGIIELVDPFVSERMENLLLVFLPVVISGGLHVDGLADFFDGFFQGKSREDILRVMKDSRIGVWGALSVIFMVLFKWELLASVPLKEQSYITALSLSRWSHVLISFLLPYVRPEGGLGQSVAGLVEKKELIPAAVFAAAVSLCLGPKGLVVFLLTGGFIFLLSRIYKHRLGGITGDVIGATGEMVEVSTLIFIVLLWKIF